jgi:hypothetical protein
MTTVATNCIYQLELEVEYINIIVLLVKTTIRWIWFAFFIIIVVVVVFNILVYSFISLQIIFAVGTTLVLYGPKTTMTEAFKHMQAWSLIQIKISLEVSVPYDILFQLHFYKKKIYIYIYIDIFNFKLIFLWWFYILLIQ